MWISGSWSFKCQLGECARSFPSTSASYLLGSAGISSWEGKSEGVTIPNGSVGWCWEGRTFLEHLFLWTCLEISSVGLCKHFLEVPSICFHFLQPIPIPNGSITLQITKLVSKDWQCSSQYSFLLPPALGLCVSPLSLRKRQCSPVMPTEMLLVLEWALFLAAIKFNSLQD